jgi:DNA-binding protein H-NS
MRNLGIVIITLLCISCAEPNLKSYIAADRATYEAISAEYVELVKSALNDQDEAKFTKEQIERRERLVQTWQLRIISGEEGIYPSEAEAQIAPKEEPKKEVVPVKEEPKKEVVPEVPAVVPSPTIKEGAPK